MEICTDTAVDELFWGRRNGATAIQFIPDHENAQLGQNQKGNQKCYRKI